MTRTDGAATDARRARVATTHDAPRVIARAVAPDNTDDIDTRVDGDRVVTTVDREGTGGLAATLDDYVVNVSVADRVAAAARGDTSEQRRAAQSDDRPTTDTNDT
jgi:hypothetical protein